MFVTKPQRYHLVDSCTIFDATFYACSHFRHLVDSCSESGFTPLHYAAWFDHPDTIRALVAEGAEISRRTYSDGNGDHGYM